MADISPSELDAIMDLDPLNLSAQDLDAIIEYQRRARQHYESGGKVTKSVTAKMNAAGSSLAEQLGILKPVEPVDRRF